VSLPLQEEEQGKRHFVLQLIPVVRRPKMRTWFLLTLLLPIVQACEQTAPANEALVSESRSLSDPEEQARFIAALVEAEIPFTTVVHDEREFVQWDASHSERVRQIDEQLFGPSLPVGRNVHFDGEMHERFKSWLEENEIPYATVLNRGVVRVNAFPAVRRPPNRALQRTCRLVTRFAYANPAPTRQAAELGC